MYIGTKDKFGGYKKSSSWLGKKVNKISMCIATMQMLPARTCPRVDAASQQDISTSFIILIEFEATDYSYSIRIRNFEDIRFK